MWGGGWKLPDESVERGVVSDLCR